MFDRLCIRRHRQVKIKESMKINSPLFIILNILWFLASCSNRDYNAPVKDYLPPASMKVTEYVVAPGDTLYSIAWRFNLDYKKFARANNVNANYLIQPGQKLQLKELDSPRRQVLKVEVTDRKKTSSNDSSTRVSTENPTSNRLINKPSAVKKEPGVKAVSKTHTWVWPSNGKVIERFSSNRGLNKGIDINGNLGDSVLASAAGWVVYSGEGLRGYGKLIIIKHNEKYLSAYAHNSKLFVVEGDSVKVSQKIAEMGSTGTDSVKLHFEIRDDGKPVDPLTYLPKR